MKQRIVTPEEQLKEIKGNSKLGRRLLNASKKYELEINKTVKLDGEVVKDFETRVKKGEIKPILVLE